MLKIEFSPSTDMNKCDRINVRTVFLSEILFLRNHSGLQGIESSKEGETKQKSTDGVYFTRATL